MSIYGSLFHEGFLSDRKKQKEEEKQRKAQEQQEAAIQELMDYLKEILTKNVKQLNYEEELSIWLFFHEINKNQFNKLVSAAYKVETKNFSENGLYKYEPQEVKFAKKFDGSKWVYMNNINDRVMVYFIDKGQFLRCGDDEGISEGIIMSFENMVSECKTHNTFVWYNPDPEDLIEVDKRMGYYKLSTPPKGTTPKPVPDYKK